MATINVRDAAGKITARLHNRKERRKFAKANGVRLEPAGAPQYRPRGVVRPIRHVTSREPFGGSGPSEKVLERQELNRELHARGEL